MHPHVAKVMLDQGFDLCVYNYGSSLGATPADRHVFASHRPSGTFDGLVTEMGSVVKELQTKYMNIVVYAHSTGALILTNYLLETPMTPFMMDVLKRSPDLVLQSGNTFDSWHARLHTQHEYDAERYRSYQSVHITLGYVMAAQRVINKLETLHHHEKLFVTTVPVCLLTVRDDDTLDAVETIRRTGWLGPSDVLVPHLILDHGSHDVFLSPLVYEVQAALNHFEFFLCQHKAQRDH
jgi:alpha-beta hydrolase superfamily lysophospholipase